MSKARGMGLATRGAGCAGKEMGYKSGGTVEVRGYQRGGPIRQPMLGKTGKSSFKIAKPKPMGDPAPTMGADMGAEQPMMKSGGIVTGATKKDTAYGLPAYKVNQKGAGYAIPDKGKMTSTMIKVKGTKEPKSSRGQ